MSAAIRYPHRFVVDELSTSGFVEGRTAAGAAHDRLPDPLHGDRAACFAEAG